MKMKLFTFIGYSAYIFIFFFFLQLHSRNICLQCAKCDCTSSCMQNITQFITKISNPFIYIMAKFGSHIKCFSKDILSKVSKHSLPIYLNLFHGPRLQDIELCSMFYLKIYDLIITQETNSKTNLLLVMITLFSF